MSLRVRQGLRHACHRSTTFVMLQRPSIDVVMLPTLPLVSGVCGWQAREEEEGRVRAAAWSEGHLLRRRLVSASGLHVRACCTFEILVAHMCIAAARRLLHFVCRCCVVSRFRVAALFCCAAAAADIADCACRLYLRDLSHDGWQLQPPARGYVACAHEHLMRH
jgi:hypothetical protein